MASTLGRSVFDAWPAPVLHALDGNHLAAYAGLTLSLITVDEHSRAYTSLLGVGEVYAPQQHTLRFALWPGSRAVANLRRAPQATLSFVFDAAFYQVFLQARRLADGEPAAAQGAALVCYDAVIDSGEAQRVSYARLTSGISFELTEPGAAVLERWAAQVEALRRLG